VVLDELQVLKPDVESVVVDLLVGRVGWLVVGLPLLVEGNL